MDQQSTLATNAQVRQRFSQDYHLLSNKITRLQTSNEKLSAKLDALIHQKLLLIERLKDLISR